MDGTKIEYLAGWHGEEKDAEGTFRWMDKRALIAIRNLRTTGRKYVRMIAGHTFPSKKPPLLEVSVNGRQVMRREIPAISTPYFFSFPDMGDVSLEFVLDGVFRIPEDSRNLGIIVRRVEVLSPQQTDVVFGEGWYHWEEEREGNFRWMSGKARMLLARCGPAPNRYLRLSLFSEYADFSQVLSVESGGKTFARIPLLANWNEYSLSLPDPGVSSDSPGWGEDGFLEIVLTLNKLIPRRLQYGDSRELGVRVRRAVLHDAAGFHKDFLFFHRNAYLNYQEAMGGKTKLDSFPPYLGIDLYGRCNITPPCVYCEWDWMKKVEGKAADAVVDEKTLSDYGPFFRAARNLINCSIGEPLLHPSLERVLDLCERSGKTLEMATNAQALTLRVIRALAGKKIDLYVSLDAACRETYAKIRNGRWDQIIPNLILLNEERKRAGNLPRVFMIFMPMRVNRNDLEDFFRLCQRIEADLLILRPLNLLFDQSRKVERGGYCFHYERERLGREELEQIFRACQAWSRTYNVPVGNQFDFGISPAS